MADWLNVGRFANRIAAFHDIYAHEYDNEEGGIVRAWESRQEELVHSLKDKGYHNFLSVNDFFVDVMKGYNFSKPQ